MRTVLIILFLTICFSSYGQTHIEYISEKTDSMALINQKDIDIINNVFNERNVLDSLHNLNEQIIYNLESEINIQDSIILTQAQTIANNNLALLELEEHNKKIIDSYSDEIWTEKNKRITYQTFTGFSVAAIIFLLLFGK